MSKILKKLAVLVLTGLATASFCSCVNNSSSSGNDEPIIPESTVTLEVNNDEIALILGEETYLDVSYEQKEGYMLSFSSSDNAVVEVDENGKCSSKKLGQATITVSYSNKVDTLTDTATIVVELGNNIPNLTLIGVSNEKNQIALNDTLNIAPRISFNGRFFEADNISYTVSNSLGDVVDGVFTPTKTGEGTIEVKAQWCNVEAHTLTKTIPVSVINEVTLYANDGKSSYELFTLEEFGGNTYDTATSFIVYAYENGEEVTPTVEVTEGAEFIEYSVADKAIFSKGKAGTAKITISYTDVENKLYSEVITVSVVPSLADYVGDAIEFSALDGTLPLKEIFGDEIALVGAFDEDGNALIVSENKALGYEVTFLKGEKPEETTFTLYTDTCGYNVPILPFTKIIDEASDLSIFYLGDGAKGGANYPANNEQSYINAAIFDGYYTLANDIDCTGYTHYILNKFNKVDTKVYFSSEHPDAGLTGVFDGRGYTLNNLHMTKGGLFGGIVGGTVKNVAFTNVSFSTNQWKDEEDKTVSGTISDNNVLATFIDKGLVENVYIYVPTMRMSSRNDNVARSALVSSFITDRTVMKNCIFKCDTYTYTKEGVTTNGVGSADKQHGSLMSDCRGTNYQWENVYVISSVPLAECTVNGTWRLDYSADASNKNPDSTLYRTPFKGVYRYDTQADMLAANIDFSAFKQSGYWTVLPNTIPTISVAPITNVSVVSGTYELNHETGTYAETDMQTIFGNKEVTIERVVANGLNMPVENGVVSIPVSMHGKELTLYVKLQGSETYYAVTTTVVTKYIDEASDLSIFYLGDEAVGGSDYPSKNYQSYKNTAIFDGYYVLTKDIDCTGYTHYVLKKENKVDTRVYFANGTHPDAGLTGTFDGRGHTISNLTMTKGGLFGGIVGGTVKNVAFTNVSFSANTWKDENGTTVYGTMNDSCTLATFIDRGLVENVYIYVPTMALPSRNGNVSRNALVSSFVTESTVMKNCIFKCDTYTYGTDNLPGVGSNNKHYGSIMSDCRGTDYQWQNVYVISNVALAYTSTKVDFCADATNKDASCTKFTGVSRYDTQGDFEQATGNDYTSFSNTYWDTTSGVPVWKN